MAQPDSSPVGSGTQTENPLLQSAQETSPGYQSFQDAQNSQAPDANTEDAGHAPTEKAGEGVGENAMEAARTRATGGRNNSEENDVDWNSDQDETPANGWEGMHVSNTDDNVNFVSSVQQSDAATDTKPLDESDEEKEECEHLEVRTATRNKELQVTCSWTHLRKEYSRAVQKKFKLKNSIDLISDVSDEELMWWRYRKCRLETYDDTNHVAEIKPDEAFLEDKDKSDRRIWLPYKTLIAWKS